MIVAATNKAGIQVGYSITNPKTKTKTKLKTTTTLSQLKFQFSNTKSNFTYSFQFNTNPPPFISTVHPTSWNIEFKKKSTKFILTPPKGFSGTQCVSLELSLQRTGPIKLIHSNLHLLKPPKPSSKPPSQPPPTSSNPLSNLHPEHGIFESLAKDYKYQLKADGTYLVDYQIGLTITSLLIALGLISSLYGLKLRYRQRNAYRQYRKKLGDVEHTPFLTATG